jgi:hypothetical protein
MRDFLHAAIDYGDREVDFLKEGYGPSEALDDRFDLRLHLSLVPFRVGILAHTMKTEDDPSVADDVRGLRRTMAWLKGHGAL